MARTILATDPGHSAAKRVASVSTVQPTQLLQLLQSSNVLAGSIVRPETLDEVCKSQRAQRLYSGVSLVIESQTAAAAEAPGPAVQLSCRRTPDGAAGASAEANEPGCHGGDWQNASMDNVLAGWSAEERLIIKLDDLTWSALAYQVWILAALPCCTPLEPNPKH